MFETVLAVLGASFLVTYITNPFASVTIIRLPYRIRLGTLIHEIIDNNHKIKVHRGWLWKAFAYYQCALYIFSTRYITQKEAKSSTLKAIIAEIHTLRFNPKKLLLISGDHFNGLFVRNLGIFYYPTLDANIYTTEKDWQHRQETYLQTVAYALGVFEKDPRLKTTLLSTGPYSAVGINFYSYPSDSLYGMLYALSVLLGKDKAGAELYHVSHIPLDTIPAAELLLESYSQLLADLYASYKEHVFDSTSQLIKTTIHVSSAKDITKRQSSFYDNVIFWRTTQLAMKLGIIADDQQFLRTIKKTILKTFWLEDEGYFVEDLSTEAIEQRYYSSDWLIVLSTGFLHVSNQKERHYYERSMAYISKSGVARPFAIKYQNDTRAHRQFLPVRLAVASYGGDAIWSFWGMEYIKTALLLFHQTHDLAYLSEADYHIKKYKENIIKNKGFPEVYDPKGDILQTPFYRSILMTGWVVGFEQVIKMRNFVKNAL